MWRQNSYENKLSWILVVLVIMVVALTALWLYQANLVTFGLKHSSAGDNCSDLNQPDQYISGKCAGTTPVN